MKHLVTIMAAMLLIVVSCAKPVKPSAQPHDEKNAVYYWKTAFRLDSADRVFLRTHDVARVYLRLFDVANEGVSPLVSTGAVPNASVTVDDDHYSLLRDSLNYMEFVPVVYVTTDALRAMKGQEGLLASNIVTRVKNMCQYNGLPNVKELQLDCDWTASLETSFFKLCDSVKLSIDSLKLPWRLSSTIRLHQLARKAPPVDRAVLMVYNTGCFDNPDARNSILDAADVEPYLKYLHDYPMHLDVAYPTYSWQLLFHGRQFVGLLNGVNLADTSLFEDMGEHRYRAKHDIPHHDRIIRSGDIIRQETTTFQDIYKVKKMIEKQLGERSHSNILYHLDTKNFSKFSSDEITRLFSTTR